MHYPVMASNVIKAIASLNIHRTIKVADCNFGLGGHSNAILKQFPNTYVYTLPIYIVSTAYDLDLSIIERYRNTASLQIGDQARLKIVN